MPIVFVVILMCASCRNRGRDGNQMGMSDMSGMGMGGGMSGMNMYSPGLMMGMHNYPMSMQMQGYGMGYPGMSGMGGPMHHNIHINTSGLNYDGPDADLLNSPTGVTKKTAEILFSMPVVMNADREDVYGSSGATGSSTGFFPPGPPSGGSKQSGDTFGSTQLPAGMIPPPPSTDDSPPQGSQLSNVTGSPPVPALALNSIALLPPDFPHPSPAACGKRKHAELSVAQMLAGVMAGKSSSSSTLGSSLSSSSLETLSKGRAAQGPSSSVNFSLPATASSALNVDIDGGDSFAMKRAAVDKSLSIINPDIFGDNKMTTMNPPSGVQGRPLTPSTPWDRELRDMENRSKSSYLFPTSGTSAMAPAASLSSARVGGEGMSAYLSNVLRATSSDDSDTGMELNPAMDASTMTYGNGSYSQSVMDTIATLAKDYYSSHTVPHGQGSVGSTGSTPFSPSARLAIGTSPILSSQQAAVRSISGSSRTMSMMVRSNSTTSTGYRMQQHTFNYASTEEELQCLYAILNIIISKNSINATDTSELEQFLLSIIDGSEGSGAESKEEVPTTPLTLDSNAKTPKKTTYVSRLLNKLFPEGVSVLHVVCSGFMYTNNTSSSSPGGSNRRDNQMISDESETESLSSPNVRHILAAAFSPECIHNVVRVLLSFGASTHILDHNFNTPLHVCAQASGKHIIRCLTNNTPIGAGPVGFEHIGKLLLNSGCPLNAVNIQGDTGLHIASRYGDIKVIDLMLGMGCNVHIRNKQGQGALDSACLALTAFTNLQPLTVSNNAYIPTREAVRTLMLSREPRLRTLVLYHDDCLDHSARRQTDWEGPDRLQQIMNRLTSSIQSPGNAQASTATVSPTIAKLFAEYELEVSNRFEKAGVELLERVHSLAYIQLVDSLSKQLQVSISTSSSTDSDGGKGKSAGFMPPPPPDSLPFTPQVQRQLLKKPTEQLKKSEHCDTTFSAGTLSAARRAAGAVAHAIDYILAGLDCYS
jgi:hypothetical protein